MGENSSGQITIYGPVLANRLDALIEAIEGARCGPEWCNYFKDADDVRAFVAECDGSSVLKLYDSEACYGEFEYLQAFLEREHISYCQSWEGAGEAYDNGYARYEPGLGRRTVLASNDGEPVLRVGGICAAMADGTLQQLVDDACWIAVTAGKHTLPVFTTAGPLNRALEALLAEDPR